MKNKIITRLIWVEDMKKIKQIKYYFNLKLKLNKFLWKVS
jgi:hypothetical protein